MPSDSTIAPADGHRGRQAAARRAARGLERPLPVNVLEPHVYPELGARKLSGIDYRDLQAFVDRLARAGLDGSTIR